jgi:hypothetical protein
MTRRQQAVLFAIFAMLSLAGAFGLYEGFIQCSLDATNASEHVRNYMEWYPTEWVYAGFVIIALGFAIERLNVPKSTSVVIN